MRGFIRAAFSAQTTEQQETYIVDANAATSINVAAHLSLPSPYNPTHVVHPGIWVFDTAWNGYTHWMAVTPYPNTNDDFENPCIFASNDGGNWFVPNGLNNPIDEPNAQEILDGLHMSDTCIYFDNGSLHCVYRFKSYAVGGANHDILMKSSVDGVNWGVRKTLIDDSQNRILLSPSILKIRDKFYMWCHVVNVGASQIPALARFECDTIDGTYTNMVVCDVQNFPANKDMWHSQVKKFGSQYHCIMNMTDDGAALNGKLIFMTSNDGLLWQCADNPFLEQSALGGWQTDLLYRSCVWINEDENGWYYDLWYSGRTGNAWEVGKTRIDF